MYKRRQQSGGTKLKINRTEEGEFLHTKIERMIANKEDITEGVSQLIYTERKEGVRPEFNPRADKWDIALEGMDKASKSALARRNEKINMSSDDVVKHEPVDGTTET